MNVGLPIHFQLDADAVLFENVRAAWAALRARVHAQWDWEAGHAQTCPGLL